MHGRGQNAPNAPQKATRLESGDLDLGAVEPDKLVVIPAPLDKEIVNGLGAAGRRNVLIQIELQGGYNVSQLEDNRQ